MDGSGNWRFDRLGRGKAIEKTCPFSKPAPRLFADLVIAHGMAVAFATPWGTTAALALGAFNVTRDRKPL